MTKIEVALAILRDVYIEFTIEHPPTELDDIKRAAVEAAAKYVTEYLQG